MNWVPKPSSIQSSYEVIGAPPLFRDSENCREIDEPVADISWTGAGCEGTVATRTYLLGE